MSTTERAWAFNSQRLQITLGVPGETQRHEFQNATLQPASVIEDGEFKLDFSIAVYVDVPEYVDTEDLLAEYLAEIFRKLCRDNPEVNVEIQVGPFEKGN
jgi:hypothetical protein